MALISAPIDAISGGERAPSPTKGVLQRLVAAVFFARFGLYVASFVYSLASLP